MNKSKISSKLFQSKAFLVIMSLLVSIVLWVYVSSVDGEEITQTFRGIKVEFVGEEALRNAKNMVITDIDTSTVSAVVRGPRRIVGTLDSSDLIAQIDVSKLSRASYTSQQYTIIFPSGTDTSNITVTGKSPDTINFMVSTQTSKTIQVRGSFNGELAEGYTAETPQFEPATITISGAESNIKNVSYAWVNFGEDNVSSTYEVETGYTLMDEAGDPCPTTGITFSDSVVTARLPVLVLKEVNLDVNVIEGAGATEKNTVIKIEPESLMLAGDSSILDGMNKIILDTIDLTSFASTFTDVYPIPLDNEIKNTTGVTEAKVTVQIAGLTTKSFSVNNISYINLTDGYEAEIISQSVDVTLRGPEDVLSQVKSENIRAVADLADYKESTGTYMPNARIYIDGFTEVGALGVTPITVEIRKGSS